MGIGTVIDRGRRVVATTFSGQISGAEILRYQQEVWGDEAVSEFDVLLDFTSAVRTDVSVEQLRELAARSHVIDGAVPSRMALVAVGPIAVTGVHVYKAARESFQGCAREVRVFDRLADARAWLGLPDEA
ncbi:MAG TPA: STAS/SEC14 domain-containing protein [Planctomycetota bacterium]|nr:STAS/SEC14 domain-containing protein [Planctomycetota bacterium]